MPESVGVSPSAADLERPRLTRGASAISIGSRGMGIDVDHISENASDVGLFTRRTRRSSANLYLADDRGGGSQPSSPSFSNPTPTSNPHVIKAIRLMREKNEDRSSMSAGKPASTSLAGGVLAKSEQTIERLNGALKSAAFQPDDIGIWYWDTTILLCLTYYGVFIPCQYAMERDDLVAGEWGHFALDVICTVVFLIDLFVRMHTCYFEPVTGMLIEDMSKIRQNYIRTEFWRDFLPAMPVDLIILYTVGENVIHGWVYVAALSLCKLPKFLIVPKLFKVMTPVKLSPFSVKYQYTVVPMIRLLFYCALAINMITVLWVILNKNGVQGTTDDTYSYITGLYWTLYTVTTVGYGDVPVDSPGKKLFACLLFITGVIVHGVVISKISSRMQKGDVESERTDTMKETLSVLKKFNIPKELACEVLAFQYHQLHSDVSGGFEKVLQSLPSVMRNRVSLFVRMKFICLVPMFKEQPIECRVGLANALKALIYEPEECIVKAGDDGKAMFFLGHGFAEVTSPVGDPWGVIKPGGFFGEIALLTDSKRTASITTLTYCKMFRLDKGDFFVLIRKHPGMKEAVAQEMLKRQIKLNNAGTEYKLEMAHSGDIIGIEWEEYMSSYIVASVDEHGAAHRAGIVQGMHLVSIDDEQVDDEQTLQLVDDTFHGTGSVCLTMLPPTVIDEAPRSSRREGSERDGEGTSSTQPFSTTPFALDLSSEQGGNSTPRGTLARLARGESESSFNSEENSPVRGGTRRRTKVPDITLHPPPGVRGSGARPMQELAGRISRVEDKQTEMTHSLHRIETMMQALLNTLGLVVEKEETSRGDMHRKLSDMPVLNPPPDRYRMPEGDDHNPTSPESSCVRSIQSLQDGVRSDGGSQTGSQHEIRQMALLRNSTEPMRRSPLLPPSTQDSPGRVQPLLLPFGTSTEVQQVESDSEDDSPPVSGPSSVNEQINGDTPPPPTLTWDPAKPAKS
eukprot:TRINITY_DN991_c0_g1_i3.p1 TRINITY_DN991_c0_g1~~TRINITY_DN991_c0_g1_i3.p1  ORF type:complete len:966 (+),score=317.63 TRINITY_DN991_c0_g1_i3:1638-4535(+)